MVTLADQPTDQQGEYSAICLFEDWKIEGRDLQFGNQLQKVLSFGHCAKYCQSTPKAKEDSSVHNFTL